MKCLFEVFKKDDMCPERIKVFAVRDDKNGYPHFLVYEEGQWKYVSAKNFTP